MAKYEIKISEKQETDAKYRVITLSGDISLNNTEEIKEKLMPEISKHNTIKIVTEEVNNIDLSMIQMFYAIRNTALAEHKTIVFEIGLPAESMQLIKSAGFDDFQKLNVVQNS